MRGLTTSAERDAWLIALIAAMNAVSDGTSRSGTQALSETERQVRRRMRLHGSASRLVH